MSQEIEVGDTIKALVYSTWYYLVVEEINHPQQFYAGFFGTSIEEVRKFQDSRDLDQWGRMLFRERPQIAAKRPAPGAASPNPASRGACSCPWSMLVRGCECGAIKKFQPTY
jgi:hypothetical protein